MNSNIPKKIFLCYKTKKIPDYVMSNWKEVYPDYKIFLYDDNDCIAFLKKNYGSKYVDIFNYIKDGAIKADFWRVCILYKYGGIYSDIDVKPIKSIETITEKETTFITSLSASNMTTNPHFIVSIPQHKLLKMCIDTYLSKYDSNKKYSYWGWSIIHIMQDNLNKVFGKKIKKGGVYLDEDNNKYQFLKERSPTPKSLFDFNTIWNRITFKYKDFYCDYKGIKILENKYSDYYDNNFS
jgi:mannosyltransferase OCH1-like enzyme